MIVEEITITTGDTPWEIACMLINAEYEVTSLLNITTSRKFFESEDLRRIGEHLVNYCNTEKEGDGEND